MIVLKKVVLGILAAFALATSISLVVTHHQATIIPVDKPTATIIPVDGPSYTSTLA